MKQYKLNLKIGLAFTTLLLGSLECATAQGNLVFNGYFDYSLGWSTVNVGSGGGYMSQGGNPGGYFYIDPAAAGTSTISQTIKVNPGVSYIVSGDYMLGNGSPADSGFGVAINGSYLFEGSATTAWQHFSFIYTADSSGAVLSLSSQLNGTGDAYRIDNISIVAVPEPSSLRLIGMGGLAGVMFLRRKVSEVRS